MGENLPLGTTAQHTGHADGTSPGAAGQGFPCLAPRSAWSSPRTRLARIRTLMRLGKCESVSIFGPTPSTQSSLTSSTNVMQCGFPIETQVTHNPSAILHPCYGTTHKWECPVKREIRVSPLGSVVGDECRIQDRLAHIDAARAAPARRRLPA